MAPRLSRWSWVLVPALACGVVAVAYLPPRPIGPRGTASPLALKASRLHNRSIELAEEWRRWDFARRSVEYRIQLTPDFERLARADSPSVVVRIIGPDTTVAWVRELVEPAIRTGWHELGLGVTKVSVGVVVDLTRIPGAAVSDSSPAPSAGLGSTYLLPDSTDPAACIALVQAPYFLRRRLAVSRAQAREWLIGALGPCAFYARFGVPGERVRAWLSQRNYDLAATAVWHRPADDQGLANWPEADALARGWWWAELYGFKFTAVACLAGREADCRRAIRRGDTGAGPASRVTSPVATWRRSRIELLGGERWLSDVARAVGDARFREFWGTTLPVDSALTLALRQPVGRWTAEWQGQIGARPVLGPQVGWLDTLTALMVSVAALALLLSAVARREAR